MIKSKYSTKQKQKMKSADKEEIFALLNLLSDDDCPHPIWNDIANKIRMSKDKEIDTIEKTRYDE